MPPPRRCSTPSSQPPTCVPYEAAPANVNLEERNAAHAWGGRIKMNFAREDAVDDLLLNEVVWRSVRGADSPMPAPCTLPSSLRALQPKIPTDLARSAGSGAAQGLVDFPHIP